MSSFGISERFQNRSGTKYGLFDAAAMTTFLAQRGQMVQQKMCAFSLSRSALSAYNYTLILSVF